MNKLLPSLNFDVSNIKMQIFKRSIFVFGFFICLIVSAHAQKTKVYKLSEDKSEIVSTFVNDQNVDGDRLVDLIYNLNPTIYIKDGVIKLVSGESPTNVTLQDVRSFGILQNEISDFTEVEIIRIDINKQSSINKQSDLAHPLDFSTIKGFNNLRYIYVLSSFNCSESDIRRIISNLPVGITIFYQVSNPS